MRRGRFDRDELLARIDLRALLDELSGPATGPGRTARWHCPAVDHDDVHPSVTVRPDRRGIDRWRCWSGGHGGTAIDAIQVAMRKLANGNRVGIPNAGEDMTFDFPRLIAHAAKTRPLPAAPGF